MSEKGGGGDYSGTLDCHINTHGMNPESMTTLLAHLYTSLHFKLGNHDVNILPSLTKVASNYVAARGFVFFNSKSVA